MKRLFLFISVLLFFLAGCSNSPISQNSKTNGRLLRVLCYNIHHCSPPSKPDLIDVDAIARVINAQNPDLVALQEIDVRTTRSGTDLDQIQALATKTNMKFFFAKGIDYGGGEYGVGILSKFDILDSKRYPLPSDPDTKGEPRVLATVRVKNQQGFEFIFGSTHLDAQKANTNREMQITEITKIAASQTLPMILAGDFNATPDNQVIKTLDQHFQRTCTTCAPTIPVINPNKAIDFITFRPKGKFKVVSHVVIPESYASDHLPVFSLLEIKN